MITVYVALGTMPARHPLQVLENFLGPCDDFDVKTTLASDPKGKGIVSSRILRAEWPCYSENSTGVRSSIQWASDLLPDYAVTLR